MPTYNEICAVLNKYEESRDKSNACDIVKIANVMCSMLDELKFLTLSEDELNDISE